MNTSTIEYIRYRIAPERTAEFIDAYRAAGVPLLASEYCLGYDLAHCVEESDRFILRIQWTSVDDHLQKFRAGKHFRDFFAHIAPFVDHIEEMLHYAPALVGYDIGRWGAFAVDAQICAGDEPDSLRSLHRAWVFAAANNACTFSVVMMPPR